MRRETLSWLVCAHEACSVPLSVSERFDARWNGANSEELLEGILVCTECGASYPVVLGVAVLVGRLGWYLGQFVEEISACASEEPGHRISNQMVEFLRGASVPDGAVDDNPPDRNDPAVISRYLQWHFDARSLPGDLPAGWWREAVEEYLSIAHDPYTYLIDSDRWTPSAAVRSGLAVDVGCGVGRVAAELALIYRHALGVDWSFRTILSARRYLLRTPSPLQTYSLADEGPSSRERPLAGTDAAGNLDFVVADAAALPLATAGSGCLAALNVLCTLPEPTQLFTEAGRVLCSDGSLLVSSPYCSRVDARAGEGYQPLGMPGSEYVRRQIRDSFRIIAEEDAVPWLFRIGRRQWHLFLCHCLVATRRARDTA